MQTLPIHQHFEEISALLTKHQVILVAGETGSGKSTQLPQLCYALFKDKPGLIGHTQPRRIAAKTIAARVAEEMKSLLGQLVGYQVRFNDALSEATRIKIMTDGILLAETRDDPLLKRYHTLIIDEAHERSLNIDFILGYLKKILPKRPDLKVIITSATLDHERLAKHFTAPVVEVAGRTFPISLRYQPLNSKAKEARDVLYTGVVSALISLQKEGWGDVLVFLPTEREIREYRRKLAERFDRYEVLPLYARLPLASQQKIFHPGNQPRIILATNVAETSITVPNIRYVIDSGLARVSRFNAKLKIQRLPIEAISQANAKQRAGRAGRTSEGIVIRLYSEEDFQNRPPFLEPELLRTNLAAVILMMLKLNLGGIEDFPFIDPPPNALINEGYKELLALQAIEGDRLHPKLSKIGRQMSEFPVDPRLARMLIAGVEFRVPSEILAIVSNLTIQDPREYPEEELEKAKAKHQRYAHPESEFLTILNVWTTVHRETEGASNNQFKRYCEAHYLSHNRMREWQALHAELLEACKQIKKLDSDDRLRRYKDDDKVSYQAIHQALLTGSLHFIGHYDDEKQCYRGAENKLFQIFPGSILAKKKFKWLMAESLMETQKVYARIVARIEPNWLEPLSKHLVKKQYSEPTYDAKMDEVIAYETVLLYGLPIITRRKTLFAKKNPTQAREVFIREGLVPTQNQKEREILQNWEAKLRRLGICFTDDEAFEFYNRLLPQDAVSFKTLNAPPPQFDISDRLAQLKPYEKEYPDFLTIKGKRYKLDYQFEPGEPNDGTSLLIPLKDLIHLENGISHPHTDTQLKFVVINEEDQPLARSTSISALKKHFADTLNTLINEDLSPFGDQIYKDWTFGTLPEMIDDTYPALYEAEEGVQIKLYHDADEAHAIHAEGVFALLKTHYAKELKTLRSDPKVINELSKLTFIQDKASLIEEFVDYALWSFFDKDDINLGEVRTEQDFKNVIALKSQLYNYQLELQKWLQQLTAPLLEIRVQLKNLGQKQGLAKSAYDLQSQFLVLCEPHFFLETPRDYLKRYPVYFKGMQLRIQRLQNNPERELRLFAEFEPIWKKQTNKTRWLFEEYRLALFAQELKTMVPISTKKMLEILQD